TGELVTFAAFVSHKQTDVPLDAAPAGLIVNFTSNGETIATTTTPICTEVAGTCQARQEAHLR
ncbi:hypothetical protein, partial [Neoaquamicrobium microcysteis]|uniref:hypothetical protein n=1 Tax=Neoaquamicrobium microcysteis TaxID=2682781 RepID=UPI00137596E5